MMSQYGFYFDMTSCIGCRTCQVSCKDKNDLKVGTIFRRVKAFETGSYPQPGIFHYSSTCNHCESPKCVEGCPTQALHKLENGIVDHDKNKCIGCRYCTWSCPYGVPQFIEELGQIRKCNMCKDLIEKGENPVCVDACPMRALEWGELEDLKAKHGDSVSELPLLPVSSVTKPALLIKAKNNAKQKDFKEKEI